LWKWQAINPDRQHPLTNYRILSLMITIRDRQTPINFCLAMACHKIDRIQDMVVFQGNFSFLSALTQ
jgi:hypothetical protein